MFPLMVGGVIRDVAKISAGDFSPHHHATLDALRFDDSRLAFPDPQWASTFLGAGEEKAVFCVCDGDGRVFAVEALDERTYLNGRFVGGEYFFDQRVPGLRGVKLNPDSFSGLTFSGKVRVREYVHGYEWARFEFDPRHRTALDAPLTAWLRTWLSARFNHYRAHYRDVHDRNILFELRPPTAPGVPVIVRN